MLTLAPLGIAPGERSFTLMVSELTVVVTSAEYCSSVVVAPIRSLALPTTVDVSEDLAG